MARVGARSGWAPAAWALLALTAAVGHPGPAGAAGGRLAPVAESYGPGEQATMVGYTLGPAPGPPGPARFVAYLRPPGPDRGPAPAADDVVLGPLVVEETAHTGFLHLRVSLTFEVPAALEPGSYQVGYCDQPCTGARLGDLGASPLSIGETPARPVFRDWAFDEPEIANLAPDALITGPDLQATAADVRAGRVAAPLEPPPTTAPPARLAPPAPRSPTPAPGAMDWRPAAVLAAVAAALTWMALSRIERAHAPELAPPRGRAGDRAAAADRG